MKTITIILILCITLSSLVYSADWNDDPANCEQVYNSISCGADRVCGITGSDTPYCYDTSSLSWGSKTVSVTDYTSDYDGGGIINCESTDGSSPYCDNSGSYYCDRYSGYYTTQHRYTNCTGFGTYEAGICRSGYKECDGGNNDCEVVNNADCASNSHFDTNDPCFGTYGNCDCNSGYDDCDNNDGDSNQETGQYSSTGCEIREYVTNYPTGANNRYDSNCGCICDSNYKDCDSSGCDTGTGCDYHYNIACGTDATWISTCNTCQCDTNYYYCDGAPDDGDGCEIHDSGTCTVGSLSGVWSCSTGTGGCYTVSGGTQYDCTCIVDKSYYETGTEVSYSTSSVQDMLQGTDYGTGDLFNMTNTNFGSWVINASGCILWMDGTSTCTNPTGGSGTDTQKKGDKRTIYNDSTTMYLNETTNNATINASIDVRVTESFLRNILDSVYSTITSLSDYLKITDLDNSTIIRAGLNESWVRDNQYGNETSRVETNIINIGLVNDTIYTVNTTSNIEELGFVTGSHTIDTDTQKKADNIALYNDTDTIYGNQTWFNISNNASIDSRVTESFLRNILDTVYSTIASLSDYVTLTTFDTIGNWSKDRNNVAFTNESNTFDESQTVTGTLTATTLSGNLAWSNLNSYPSACTSNTAITSLGDSITCTTFSTIDDNTSWNKTYANSLYVHNSTLTNGYINVTEPSQINDTIIERYNSTCPVWIHGKNTGNLVLCE